MKLLIMLLKRTDLIIVIDIIPRVLSARLINESVLCSLLTLVLLDRVETQSLLEDYFQDGETS